MYSTQCSLVHLQTMPGVATIRHAGVAAAACAAAALAAVAAWLLPTKLLFQLLLKITLT